jgi:asparagine synthase (glutamine-hydrolysing)
MSLNKLRFYTPELQRDLVTRTPYAELGLNRERMLKWHPFHRSILLGARIMLPGHLLASKGDRVAMYNSVEVRPPFLDEDLVAYTNRLHPNYKLRRFHDKFVLRKFASKYLPREIAQRPKKMFRAPLDSFRIGGAGAPAWIEQSLSPESIRKAGYFDADAVAHFRMRSPKLRRLQKTGVELGLAGVIATQLWHHLYIGGNLCDLPHFAPSQNTPLAKSA